MVSGNRQCRSHQNASGLLLLLNLLMSLLLYSVFVDCIQIFFGKYQRSTLDLVWQILSDGFYLKSGKLRFYNAKTSHH